MTGRRAAPRIAWLGLLVLSFAWGTSFLFTALALHSLSPMGIVAGRIIVAAIVLNLVRIAAGLRLPRAPSTWLRFALFALTGSVVPFALISWGQVEVSSGLAGILLTTTPLVTMTIAHFALNDEKATPRRFAGLVVGLAGIVVLLDPSALDDLGSRERLFRQLAILGGACCYAINTTIVRRSSHVHPLVYGSGVMLVGSPLALLAAWLDQSAASAPDPLAVLSVLWLGVVPTALATLVHFRVVSLAGPSFTSLTSYGVPVVAMLAGVLVFGEALSFEALICFGLLLAGIALVQSDPGPARPAGRGVPPHSAPSTRAA